MNIPIPPTASIVVAGGILAVAMITDARSRRIPNVLTFPAMAVGVTLWCLYLGWSGLLLGFSGAFAAPLALLILRGFRPLGMGDVKLAAAVGALSGPAVGALAMLVSSVTGGLLALLWLLRPGTSAARMLSPFFIGLPVLGRRYASAEVDDTPAALATLPYGIAIGVGSMLTLGYFGWM